ncbi:dehyrdogenase reductase domain-containing [Trichoderma cornu-damae]|uniref:Dehyrdogenase reductase domain-containing n=1 Tax=Trichoderma cornu-damae TaxID=654480 RepID=A0A9P8QHZ0_9HYPO|nr:dehyrdogenase reductase domain-containing [Trichoderma cornu-damae]
MSALKYVNKLQGQRVLVIGGSTGVGFCVAEAALEHGAQVIISSSNEAKLSAALARLHAHVRAANLGDPDKLALAKTCDLGNMDNLDESVVGLFEFATKGGKLDHVVFTAGDNLNIMGLRDATVKGIRSHSEVRIIGAIMVAKHLHKYVNQRVQSSFTMTGGTNSWRPLPGWSVVTATGGGIEALSRGFAVDLRPVRSNCVLLGAVHTEIFDTVPEERRRAVLESFQKDVLTGTVGSPQDVAEAYIYCMKDSFATGTHVLTDGGRQVGNSREPLGF